MTGMQDQLTGALVPLRYTRVAFWLHWIIAALIFVTIPLIKFGSAGETALHDTATNAHKLIGITILLMTIVRIFWRLKHKAPSFPETMTRALRYAARSVHTLFYVLLLVMPLSGWWMTSAFPKRHPIEAGLFNIPFLPIPVSMQSAGAAHTVHEIGGWLTITLIILHLAAAFRHHYCEHDNVLARMSLWPKV